MEKNQGVQPETIDRRMIPINYELHIHPTPCFEDFHQLSSLLDLYTTTDREVFVGVSWQMIRCRNH
jgi:hypothetical protein